MAFESAFDARDHLVFLPRPKQPASGSQDDSDGDNPVWRQTSPREISAGFWGQKVSPICHIGNNSFASGQGQSKNRRMPIR